MTFFIRLLGCLALMACSAALAGGAERDCESAPFEQVDVFTSGADGYHTYRIPAIVLSNEGTLLAFCEGRKTGQSDHGDIDLLLKRSSDLGRTWGPIRLVHEEGDDRRITIGNPCAVVDRGTGTVWLTFCRDNDRVLVTHSGDCIGARSSFSPDSPSSG